jgi:1,2-diacylglycerol 3-alpha-glucosyltransferase
VRVAILFDNFGPYHIARLVAAAAQNLDILAIEVRARSKVYDWTSSSLPHGLSYACLEDGHAVSVRSRLDEVLDSFEPDLIAVPGWSSAASLAAILWGLKKHIPIILMSETNETDFSRNPIAEAFKRQIVSSASAGLVGGASAKSYLEKLGMPRDNIFYGYDVVDNAYFARTAANVSADRLMPTVSAETRLDEKWRGRYFLASARFIPKKNLSGLLRGYARYRSGVSPEGDAWPLVLLGDGPLRQELETLRRSLELTGNVHMPGFRQYDELPRYYGTAGGFVHASTTEQWGLVVNEAMASGLPVAVSRRCGSAEMLVVEGENGVTFDPNSELEIAQALSALAEKKEQRANGGLGTRALWQRHVRCRYGGAANAKAELWGFSKAVYRIGGLDTGATFVTFLTPAWKEIRSLSTWEEHCVTGRPSTCGAAWPKWSISAARHMSPGSRSKPIWLCPP